MSSLATQHITDPLQLPILILTAIVWSSLSFRLVIPIRRATNRFVYRTSWFVAVGIAIVGIALLLSGERTGGRTNQAFREINPLASLVSLAGVWVCQLAAAIWPLRSERPG